MTEKPTRRRSATAWSAVFGYSALALALARNIALVPVYLHHMALAEYGAWLATGGALVQLVVTDFGLSGVVTQRVAHRHGAGQSGQLGPLIGAGLVNGLMLAVLLTALCLILAPFLPATQGLTPTQSHRVLQCFLLAVTANGIGVIAGTAAGISRSLHRAIATGTITLIADLLSVIVTITGLTQNFGLYSLAMGMLARSVLAAGASLVLLAVLASRDPALRWRISWEESRALWSDSAKFFLTSIAMKLQSNANILFVGMLSGPQSAAVYGLTVRAHETVLMFNVQLNTALVPSLAHLVGEEKHARFAALLARMVPVMALLAALGMTLTVTLNESFIRLWVGPQAFAGRATSILMGLAMWVAAVASVAYDASLARGEFARIARTFIAASALHVVLLLVLVRIGTWGAPLAILVTTLTWGTVLGRRVIRVSAMPRAVGGEVVAIAGISITVGALFAFAYPTPAGWLSLVAEAAACASTLVISLLLLLPKLRAQLREELALTLHAMRVTS
jgi:O-antigen/teichoic acid export membrane protein